MKRHFETSALRAGLLTGVAALALCGVAHAAEPTAAEPAADTISLDEVVVTAQKRKTNLQDTPIAISAMDSEALKARHVQSIEDLGDGTIPSLRVAPFFARKSALTIGMRGIGALGDANQPARDQAVGVYVNGVYLGRAQGLGSALYDVERIEVLKGPARHPVWPEYRRRRGQHRHQGPQRRVRHEHHARLRQLQRLQGRDPHRPAGI